MSDTHAVAPYRTYWIAWLILLGLTLLMVGVSHPAVLLGGIALKSTIIALWFMHLRWERMRLGLAVAIAIVATTLVLFALIAVDAKSM